MHALARRDQVTTGLSDHWQVGQLAGDDGCHGLIETPPPGRRIASSHKRKAFERQAADIEIDTLLRAANRAAHLDVFTRCSRIVLAEECGFRLAVAQPSVLARRLQPFEQPLRSVQPPVRDRGISAKRTVVPIEPHGDAGGTRAVASLVIEAVRLLARVEHARRIVEPPACSAETFERFRTWSLPQRGFKRGARLFPRTPSQGAATTLQLRVRH